MYDYLRTSENFWHREVIKDAKIRTELGVDNNKVIINIAKEGKLVTLQPVLMTVYVLKNTPGKF